jgi:lysine decarboxylase
LTGKELPPGYGLDPLKVVFSLTPAGWPGHAAEKVLRGKYRIQVEYADLHNLYLIISPAQKPGEIKGLLKACRALAKTRSPGQDEKTAPPPYSGGELLLPPREAVCAASIRVPLRAAAGRMAAGWVAAYPPGIPLWIPGEKITGEMVEWALAFQAAGGWLRGLEGDMTRVLADGG